MMITKKMIYDRLRKCAKNNISDVCVSIGGSAGHYSTCDPLGNATTIDSEAIRVSLLANDDVNIDVKYIQGADHIGRIYIDYSGGEYFCTAIDDDGEKVLMYIE